MRRKVYHLKVVKQKVQTKGVLKNKKQHSKGISINLNTRKRKLPKTPKIFFKVHKLII